MEMQIEAAAPNVAGSTRLLRKLLVSWQGRLDVIANGCIRGSPRPMAASRVAAMTRRPTAFPWLALLVLPMSVLAAPGDAIPFFCSQAVGIGAENVFSCRRADTRTTFTTVPTGFFLHVTDIVVDPNDISTSGVFKGRIGRDDSTAFPLTPSIDLIGFPTQQLHFSTPYIVLREGEAMSVSNLASSDFPIDVRVSGYLSASVAP